MLSGTRRLRAEQARARLLALAPRWTPTPEVIDAELSEIDGLRSRAPSPRGVLVDPSTDDVAGHDIVLAPERRTIPAFAVLIAGGLAGAALVWFLAVPRGEAVQPVAVTAPQTQLATPSASAAAPGSAGAVAAAGTQGVVVIDVQGAVRRPGVVELDAGSRVVDALAAAGGVTRAAVTTSLNLAQVLTDGIQVVVPNKHSQSAMPSTGGAGATGTGTASGGLINLNSATLEDLDSLPGIGPVLAQRILDYRTQHGPFSSINQLTDVSGIGDATFADLEPLVIV